jgi:hypothetical protein
MSYRTVGCIIAPAGSRLSYFVMQLSMVYMLPAALISDDLPLALKRVAAGLGDGWAGRRDPLAPLALVRTGRAADAATLLAAAAPANLADPVHWHNLGIVQAMRGRDGYRAAFACAMTAVAIDPGFAAAWLVLATVANAVEHWRPCRRATTCALLFRLDLPSGIAELCLMTATFRLGEPVRSRYELGVLLADPRDLDLSAALPVAALDLPDFGGATDRIVFAYCSDDYLRRYAVPMVMSLDRVGWTGRVHLHVADPTPASIALLAALRPLVGPRLSWSREITAASFRDAAKVYHACVRFCRFAQILARSDAAMIMVDADVLFRADPAALFAAAAAGDVALAVAPEQEFWNRWPAAFVAARPTPGGRDFFQRVANVVAANFLNGARAWLLDQIALAFAQELLGRRVGIARIPAETVCNLDYAEDAAIWAIANDKHMVPVGNAFDVYRQQLAELADARLAVAAR